MLFILVVVALAFSGAAGMVTGLQSFPDSRRHLLRVRVAGTMIVASVALWLAVIAVGIVIA